MEAAQREDGRRDAGEAAEGVGRDEVAEIAGELRRVGRSVGWFRFAFVAALFLSLDRSSASWASLGDLLFEESSHPPSQKHTHTHARTHKQPPPPPKQKSKWDEFALKRGIAPHEKRSRKVYDESTGEWRHLTGSSSNRANAGPESWPIIEVKKNDDPNRDPWEKLREEKKARVGKNTVGRMRNAERAGSLERGSANRLVKDNARLEKQRDMMREKDRKRGLAAPAGVPTDMMARKGKKGGGAGGGEDVGGGGAGIVRRGKPSTTLALKATQVSTASLGKFDRLREGEPERKGQLSKNVAGKKRKQPLDAGADGGGGGGHQRQVPSVRGEEMRRHTEQGYERRPELEGEGARREEGQVRQGGDRVRLRVRRRTGRRVVQEEEGELVVRAGRGRRC